MNQFRRENFCVQCEKSESELKNELFTCSGCDMIFYCSPICQEENRPKHRKYCVKIEFYFKMSDNFPEGGLDRKLSMKSRILMDLGRIAYVMAKETKSYFTFGIAKEYLDRALHKMIQMKFYNPSFPQAEYISILHFKMNDLIEGKCESYDAFEEAIKDFPDEKPQKAVSGIPVLMQMIKTQVFRKEIFDIDEAERRLSMVQTMKNDFHPYWVHQIHQIHPGIINLMSLMWFFVIS